MKRQSSLFIFLYFLLFIHTLQAQVRLASVFTDSMVLQRNLPIVLYGWGKSGEPVHIQLGGATAETLVDKSGAWRATLPAMPAGGPYQLFIKASTTISLTDLFVGDVWFCSGQSNMEWKLGWLEKEKQSLHNFANAAIRVLTVQHTMAGAKTKEIKPAVWKTLTPENAPSFSAIATYFGMELQKEKGVPIGLIVSAWGGTDIEPWISPQALSQLDKHKPALQTLAAIEDMPGLEKDIREAQAAWEDSLLKYDPGEVERWYIPSHQEEKWRTMELPGVWDRLGVQGHGNGWFRRQLTLSANEVKQGMLLSIGRPSQRADVFINGHRLTPPLTVKGTPLYAAPSSVLREGENLIALKITKLYGRGGLTGKPEDLFLVTVSGTQSLAGAWKFRPGYFSQNPGVAFSPNVYPGSLYNGMVYPFTLLPVKGVLWYQGENNTSRPQDYGWHLQELIKDWRRNWGTDSLPFLLVQLPNFLHENPANRNFVQIRQAQQAATLLPQVAMAITVDIGDSADIHPVNKHEVGRRLSLLARKMVYGEKGLLAEGPVVLKMQRKAKAVVVHFSNGGKHLTTPDAYGYVKGFELAGSDGKFYAAQVVVNGNTAVLKSDEVPKPMAVRYAWKENPDAGLFNSEGLPAAPFFYQYQNNLFRPVRLLEFQ